MAHKRYALLEWHPPPINFTLGWVHKACTVGMALSSSKFYHRVAHQRYAHRFEWHLPPLNFTLGGSPKYASLEYLQSTFHARKNPKPSFLGRRLCGTPKKKPRTLDPTVGVLGSPPTRGPWVHPWPFVFLLSTRQYTPITQKD